MLSALQEIALEWKTQKRNENKAFGDYKKTMLKVVRVIFSNSEKNEVKCQQSFTSLEGADKSVAISAVARAKDCD